jgi:hypothetical protein
VIPLARTASPIAAFKYTDSFGMSRFAASSAIATSDSASASGGITRKRVIMQARGKSDMIAQSAFPLNLNNN